MQDKEKSDINWVLIIAILQLIVSIIALIIDR